MTLVDRNVDGFANRAAGMMQRRRHVGELDEVLEVFERSVTPAVLQVADERRPVGRHEDQVLATDLDRTGGVARVLGELRADRCLDNRFRQTAREPDPFAIDIGAGPLATGATLPDRRGIRRRSPRESDRPDLRSWPVFPRREDRRMGFCGRCRVLLGRTGPGVCCAGRRVRRVRAGPVNWFQSGFRLVCSSSCDPREQMGRVASRHRIDRGLPLHGYSYHRIVRAQGIGRPTVPCRRATADRLDAAPCRGRSRLRPSGRVGAATHGPAVCVHSNDVCSGGHQGCSRSRQAADSARIRHTG